METIAVQPQRQTLSAVVYPVCVCGHSMPAHPNHLCTTYVPSRPIQDLGIISEKVIA